MTRILVVSDTHVPDHARALPAALLTEADRADLILHAGDVNRASVLEDLAAMAPTHVAMGNNDHADVLAWGARGEVRLEVDGVRIAMVHDSGPRAGRPARLARRFPDAAVVVFGHSHIPWNNRTGGRLLLNPGSPTWKRRQPVATFAILEVRAGTIGATICPVDGP